MNHRVVAPNIIPERTENGLSSGSSGGEWRLADVVSSGLQGRLAGGISARRLRLAVFLAITAFMIGGPVAEQVFGLRSVVLRSWTMFSAIGLGVIDASFAIRQADGTLVPLDRFAMLEASQGGKLRRIESRDELASIIKRLCSAVGQGADIRVRARQATRDGWSMVWTDGENACS